MNVTKDVWNHFVKQTSFTEPVQRVVEKIVFLRNSRNNWFFELDYEWKFLANNSDKVIQFYKILTLHFGNTQALHLFSKINDANNLYSHMIIHHHRITQGRTVKKPFNFVGIIKYINYLDKLTNGFRRD